MPPTIVLSELITSRNGKYNESGEFFEEERHMYYSSGDPYDVLVIAALPDIGDTHASVTSTELKEIGITPLKAFKATGGVNYPVLKITYKYSTPDIKTYGSSYGTNTNGERWEWDITSKTKHINAVLNDGSGNPKQLTFDAAHVTTAAAREDVTLIGLDGDNVNGVDVYRPNGNFRATKVYNSSSFGATERAVIASLANTTNAAAFQGYAIGTVLFVGARIAYNYATGRATATYIFLYGTKQTNVKLSVWKADPIIYASNAEVTITEILPFQYEWGNAVSKKVPESLSSYGTPQRETHFETFNVATVYESGDFSLLNLVGP